jgi:Tfp pilus assembly protein PilN
MSRIRTALGINISDNRIDLALLRQKGQEIQLVKAASGAVPDGAIKDGNVEDSEVLAKAIKELKTRNKIRERRAGISLLASPVLIQIVETPKQVVTGIGQLAQNEARRSVALSGRDIALDFCRVTSAGQDTGNRLLMVATDGQKLTELVRTCSRARLNVDVIEPPLLSYARAYYAEKIAEKYDCNVLMAVLQDSILTLAVFRKQSLDFVRTHNISEEKQKPEKLCEQLAEQINAIIRFYDFEMADSAKEWEITVVAEGVELPGDAEESLKAEVTNVSLEVKTNEDAWQDTPVAGSPNIETEKPSVVAVGLAMRLLGVDAGNLRVNLVPPESAEVRAAKKQLLVTANVLAAILLMMILASGALGLLTKRVNQRIDYKKQTGLSQAIHTLLGERDLLDRKIKQLSDRPNRLNDILGSSHAVDWAKILKDIRARTPETVRITKLQSKSGSKVYLEGLALSYDDTHLFVGMLNKSDFLESASPIETEKDYEADGLVRYKINCLLAETEKRN